MKNIFPILSYQFYIYHMKSKEVPYFVFAIISSLIIQIGAMIFISMFLYYFHQSTTEISAIIGVLSLIIGLGLANYVGLLLHDYIIKDKEKRKLGHKGNNIASVLLITLIPLLLFPYLDDLELNFDQLTFMSYGVGATLLGIVLTYILHSFKSV